MPRFVVKTELAIIALSSMTNNIPIVPAHKAECDEPGDIRLVNRSSVTTELGYGRVEVCSENRVWGTVCDEDWDELDASVVCRQLGYNGTGKWNYQEKDESMFIHNMFC